MRVLVDTSALLALSRKRDRYHARARALALRIRDSGMRYIGTTLILGEFHGHLVQLRGPGDARQALTKLLQDPAHEWIPVSAELVSAATTNWLSRFADQSFSLTDAVSFEMMSREKLTHAFAFDRHFQVAGFSLLR